METTILTPEIAEQLRPARHRYYLIFNEPTLRPPVLEEMLPDIERVIASVAQRYTDHTTPHLQFDELVGEGRLKLAELISRGELVRQTSRADFFKFFKASVNNQARSRVQKYRFTEKRTGVKPPPREQRFDCFKPASKPSLHDDDEPLAEYHKSVEMSLDDAELNLQVPDEGTRPHDTVQEVAEDYEQFLTEHEQVVFKQLVNHNAMACCLAQQDAYFHKKPGKMVIKIKHKHLAEGIGIKPELFEESVLSIRAKISNYRSMSAEQHDAKARYSAVLAQLKEVFGLQIPPIADEMLVRRLLTLAARDQYKKVNDQVVELLEEVGAKVPRIHGDSLSCYGVLYQTNHRICNSCGLRHSCATEAANLGLTKITISPKLLGARQMRIPALLPTVLVETETPGENAEEGEVSLYLEETFKKVVWKGETYYTHHETDLKSRYFLFCIGDQPSPLKLRFCKPDNTLKVQLVQREKGWYAPDNLKARDVLALIDQHARDHYR